MEVERDSLEDFFAHCPELLFIADQAGVILRMSEPLQRMLGSEARGMRLSEHVHPDDRSALFLGWDRLRASVEPARFELRLRDHHGVYQPVACNARRSTARGEVHGALHEVAGARPPATTDRGTQEAILLRVIMDNIPICMWAIDREGIFTYHDGKGLASAGLKPGQFLGLNLFELYPPGEGTDNVRRALGGETMHGCNEQHGVHWENWILPVRDAQGEVVCVVGATLDVSEGKRTEAKLRAQLDLIEQQRLAIHKLATPIIEVWDRVLTLPLMGIVDSGRVDDVMQNLLLEIVRTRAEFAILDLTGVDVVDTGTASHLLKLIQAIRLLGAEGIVTGIQPMVAETMVTLGLNLEGIVTAANLRQGLRVCIDRLEDDSE